MFEFIFDLATEPWDYQLNGIMNGLFCWLLVK